jgi:glycosyltransferase involved in cell wall biosynthesis
MATTVLVEPDPGGHRFQAVANVAQVAARHGDVVLLTSTGARHTRAFVEYLGGTDIRAKEVFDAIYPPTREMAARVADECRAGEVSTVVVMDADQSLKRWWYAAPLALRGVSRPRVVFMLTRYPAKLRLGDLTGWRLRIPKAVLAVLAMATGSLHRAAGFAGRDDMSTGWIVKRVRDPDVCTAHSRDRAALRAELGLPADRTIAGIFGVISARKHAPLIWEAMATHGVQGDLLLAGKLDPDVAAWVDSLPQAPRGRVLVRDAFLSNDELDKLVAAVDVVPIALTNNGPSGIMGKALAAGVPVVTAGSEVRARELVATDAGELAELDADSIGAAITRVLDRDPGAPRRNLVPPATVEEFAENLLGIDGDGRVTPRRGRPRRSASGAASIR